VITLTLDVVDVTVYPFLLSAIWLSGLVVFGVELFVGVDAWFSLITSLNMVMIAFGVVYNLSVLPKL